MTSKRLAVGFATVALMLGLGAGVFALAQNTNQGPPPFMGRGMGRGGPGGGGPMGMLPMLGPQLGLSDAQKDQIKTIAASHQDEWKSLGDRARTAHEALMAAVTADTVDESLIRQRSAAVAAVDADLAVARAHAHAEVFQILTPDQKAKARALQTEMQGRMKQRGPGRGLR